MIMKKGKLFLKVFAALFALIPFIIGFVLMSIKNGFLSGLSVAGTLIRR